MEVNTHLALYRSTRDLFLTIWLSRSILELKNSGWLRIVVCTLYCTYSRNPWSYLTINGLDRFLISISTNNPVEKHQIIWIMILSHHIFFTLPFNSSIFCLCVALYLYVSPPSTSNSSFFSEIKHPTRWQIPHTVCSTFGCIIYYPPITPLSVPSTSAVSLYSTLVTVAICLLDIMWVVLG